MDFLNKKPHNRRAECWIWLFDMALSKTLWVMRDLIENQLTYLRHSMYATQPVCQFMSMNKGAS